MMMRYLIVIFTAVILTTSWRTGLSLQQPRHHFNGHLSDGRIIVGNSRKKSITSLTSPPESSLGFSTRFHPHHPTTSTTSSFPLFRSSPSSSTAVECDSSNEDGLRCMGRRFRIVRMIIELLKNRFQQGKTVLKRGFVTAVIFFSILFAPTLSTNNDNSVAWAAAAGPAGVRSRSGGRVSGSFGPSTRSRSMPSRSYSSSPSRSYSRPSYSRTCGPPRTYYRPRPRIIVAPPARHIHVHGNPADTTSTTQVFQAPRQRGPSVGDVMLVGGTAALVTYGVMKRYHDNDDDMFGGQQSILGPGVSVLSLTIALSVPDRYDDNSVLARLKGLAKRTQSDSRTSVQRLVADTALEILRQERAIVSVGSEYKHFKSFKDAERQFNTMSLQKRSKFDRETFNNADGKIETAKKLSTSGDRSSATTAVIDLSLCIEGDSTKVIGIKKRSELRDALYRISADAQVDECLVAAEVLWTPDDNTDNMSEADVYADYPTLFPLFD